MPDIRERFRAEVISQLQWAGPEVTEDVLMHVATVPFFDDPLDYIAVAALVVRAALEKALAPEFERLRAESAAYRAQTAEIEAQMERSMREFEAFRRMQVPPTIQ